jgi:putative endonuclease
MASKRKGTLYTGVTSDIAKRIYEHKNHLTSGFTDKFQTYESRAEFTIVDGKISKMY